MMRYSFIISLLLLSSFLLGEKITILCSGEWKPYFYFDKKGKGKGLIFSILDRIEENSNLEFEYLKEVNWSRALWRVEQGEVDAFFPIFKTDEREKKFIYSDNNIITNEEDVVVSLKNSEVKFNGDLSSLSGLKIGVVKGYSYGKDFDSASYLNTIAVESEDVLVKLFLTGERFDCIVGDKLVLEHKIRSLNKLDKVVFSNDLIIKAPLYMIFTKGRLSTGEINKFSSELIKAKKELGID